MIKVYFSPQRSDNQIEYSFNGEAVTASIGDAEDTFDFSALPDGELHMEEPIETTLPVCPIISAKRVDGILHLELLNWLGPDAPYESRFPEWVELPLPKAEKQGGAALPTSSIPWRSKEEIDAERKAIECSDSSMDDCNKISFSLTSISTHVQIPLWTIVTLAFLPQWTRIESSDSSMDDCNLQRRVLVQQRLILFRFLYGRL